MMDSSPAMRCTNLWTVQIFHRTRSKWPCSKSAFNLILEYIEYLAIAFHVPKSINGSTMSLKFWVTKANAMHQTNLYFAIKWAYGPAPLVRKRTDTIKAEAKSTAFSFPTDAWRNSQPVIFYSRSFCSQWSSVSMLRLTLCYATKKPIKQSCKLKSSPMKELNYVLMTKLQIT